MDLRYLSFKPSTCVSGFCGKSRKYSKCYRLLAVYLPDVAKRMRRQFTLVHVLAYLGHSDVQIYTFEETT
jgi:hypothetical protein